jgi:hypothetical protein
MRKLTLLLGLTIGSVVLAQQSPSYKLREHTFNAAGHPHDGSILTSASFKIALDALGEDMDGSSLSSASFRVKGGFVATFPPPGEVTDLVFFDPNTLHWSEESAVVQTGGVYNLYRDPASGLPGNFGECLETGITTPGTHDLAEPPVGESYYYLVTAMNGFGKEGTKGFQTDNAERQGERCSTSGAGR